VEPNIEKITQVAAFILRLSGHELTRLKLIKLMYIAERESLRRTGMPMTWDAAYSLPHGPILSTSLNLMRGDVVHPYWSAHVRSQEDSNLVELIDDPGSSKLAPVEEQILGEVATQYREYSASELRNLSHKFEEWVDPKGGRRSIARERILRTRGCNVDVPEALRDLAASEAMAELLG
jgi:uncharacterized phage-associated protein